MAGLATPPRAHPMRPPPPCHTTVAASHATPGEGRTPRPHSYRYTRILRRAISLRIGPATPPNRNLHHFRALLRMGDALGLTPRLPPPSTPPPFHLPLPRQNMHAHHRSAAPGQTPGLWRTGRGSHSSNQFACTRCRARPPCLRRCRACRLRRTLAHGYVPFSCRLLVHPALPTFLQTPLRGQTSNGHSPSGLPLFTGLRWTSSSSLPLPHPACRRSRTFARVHCTISAWHCASPTVLLHTPTPSPGSAMLFRTLYAYRTHCTAPKTRADCRQTFHPRRRTPHTPRTTRVSPLHLHLTRAGKATRHHLYGLDYKINLGRRRMAGAYGMPWTQRGLSPSSAAFSAAISIPKR